MVSSICGLRLIGNNGSDLKIKWLGCEDEEGGWEKESDRVDVICVDKWFCKPESFSKWLLM